MKSHADDRSLRFIQNEMTIETPRLLYQSPFLPRNADTKDTVLDSGEQLIASIVNSCRNREQERIERAAEKKIFKLHLSLLAFSY